MIGPAGDPDDPVRATLDGDGRLVTADAAFLVLQAQAGGADDGVVAIPQIAAVARLARRLGITVARGVVVPDGPGDLDLWVRATPKDEGVRLDIAGWTARPPAGIAPASALAREHDFLRAAADWQWETDEALRLTGLSSTAIAATGTGAGTLLGQPLTRLFGFVEDANGRLPILEALAAQARFDGQIADLREGARGRVCLSGTPLLDGLGRFRGFRGAVTRVQPQAPAEEEAPFAEDVEVGAFGRQLDRALRNPLDRIVATAEAIGARNDGPLRQDYAEYAADIVAAARHLLAMVDDLVDLQAIERADFTPLDEAIDLAEAARRAAGLLAVRAGHMQVTIERPPSDVVVPARGEFRRVLQIVVNLVGNAVRYSPPGRTVRLGAITEGSRASLVVADEGRGIAPADQARIFDKFERVDPTEPGGTGLGLYIARRLARAMGGELSVESMPGEGARFTLTLPAGSA